MKTTKGKFTIATSRCDGFSYLDYLKFCEMNDLTPQGEDSRDYWDWVNDMTQDYFEDDLDNIKNCKAYNEKVKVSGSLGLWDGKHKINVMEFDSVRDALDYIIYKGDYDKYIDVIYENGIILVNESHHDGTNCFEIRYKDGRRRFPYLYVV